MERLITELHRPEELYLCPGDDAGVHITTNSRQCPCGNRNMVSLAKILNRVEQIESEYQGGLCFDLPTIHAAFSDDVEETQFWREQNGF